MNKYSYEDIISFNNPIQTIKNSDIISKVSMFLSFYFQILLLGKKIVSIFNL